MTGKQSMGTAIKRGESMALWPACLLLLILLLKPSISFANELPQVYQDRITRACEHYQRLDPELEGAIYYTISVLPNGFVGSVVMDSSDVYHQAMEDRVARIFQQAQMPKSKLGFTFRYMVFLRK